jgi:hypothetical protein
MALATLADQAAGRIPGGVFGQWTVGAVLLKPLAWLYLDGPRAWGFWGGATLPDICAQLTNTRSEFWNSNAATLDECTDIVERHYWSYVVLVSSAAYAGLIIWGLRRACALCSFKKTSRRILPNGAVRRID